MSDLEFRCLTTEDTCPIIKTLALEMNADVQYFHGRLNVMSTYMLGKYVGFISRSNKDYTVLRITTRRILDKC